MECCTDAWPTGEDRHQEMLEKKKRFITEDEEEVGGQSLHYRRWMHKEKHPGSLQARH